MFGCPHSPPAHIMSSATATMTEESGKRKASAAGLSANRPVKRRASKACCCCRARKVRCDVVENGSPCTNCRLDQVECVVTESKRRKFVLAAEKETKFHLKENLVFLFCPNKILMVELRAESHAWKWTMRHHPSPPRLQRKTRCTVLIWD